MNVKSRNLLSELLKEYRLVTSESFGDGDNPTRAQALAHTAWMCDQILDLPERKRDRWLGFVQGVLWAHGQVSIGQLREATRAVLSAEQL